MQNFDFDKKYSQILKEEETCVPGGAYFNGPSSSIGGVSAPYQTLTNTVGIGNPVPAGTPNTNNFGSGDKFDQIFGDNDKSKSKKIKKSTKNKK